MIRRILRLYTCAILLILVKDISGGEYCSTKYDGQESSHYCEIGGCCIPSDTTNYKGADLCCFSTLTIILVCSFVGGPAVIIGFIVCGCCIKRYHDNKNRRMDRDQRREERRRRRDEEEIEARNNYFNPKPEDNLRLKPPAYPGREESQDPPRYSAEPSENIPGSVYNNSLSPPPADDVPFSPPPSYDNIGSRQDIPRPPIPDTPAPAYAPMISVAPSRLANARLALGNRLNRDISSPVISERILETRNYMERFNTIESRSDVDTRNSMESRVSTVSDRDLQSRVEGRYIETIPERSPDVREDARLETNRERHTSPVMRQNTMNSIRQETSQTNHVEDPLPKSPRSLSVHLTPVRKFSKPLQFVTSLPPEEPEELAFI